MAQKIAVRGLAHMAGWIFAVWGALLLGKGVWDCFWGEPEAQFFSRLPWSFVTRAQWLRYAGFELAYGLACLAMARAAWLFARSLPEWVEKKG